MRCRELAICLASVATVLSGITPSLADHWPSYVVPTRPDVPVIINGVDASYSVVEGDWGLYRPGAMPPVVYGPLLAPPVHHSPSYYPYTGKRPRYGRLEVVPPPNRRLPPQAENYYRSWSTLPGGNIHAPLYPPPVIYGPRYYDGPVLRRGY